MKPFDIQTNGKLDAAIQQVEAAIELFYAKRYAPAITLAAAAEVRCLRRFLAPSHPKAPHLSPLSRQPSPLVSQRGLAFQRLAAPRSAGHILKDDPSALNRPLYGRP